MTEREEKRVLMKWLRRALKTAPPWQRRGLRQACRAMIDAIGQKCP